MPFRQHHPIASVSGRRRRAAVPLLAGLALASVWSRHRPQPQRRLPAGPTFVTASGGGTATGQIVTWIELASLLPGASVTLTVDARLTDVARDAYVNVAEVVDDSADTFSTATEPVDDRDSNPDQVHGEDDEAGPRSTSPGCSPSTGPRRRPVGSPAPEPPPRSSSPSGWP